MIPKSIWTKDVEREERPCLPKDIAVDTAIVGGGMAGILTAYLLKEKGVECVVLEADRVGSGQTENTTAKITSQHNLIYEKLINNLGEEKAQQYASANEAAVKHYRDIIIKENIDCQWKDCSAYLYSTECKDVLEDECKAARRLGISAYLTTDTQLPFPVRGALCYEGQASFHPLLFLQGIAKDLTIYEETRVEKAEDQLLITNRGKVEAKHIIFTCHYPFLNMPGYYFLKMYQERSYVLALENGGNIEGMYLGIDKHALSLRMSQDLLLLGGGSHRSGENPGGGQYEYLRQKAWEYWPQSRERARWSAQDCMTLDGVPYIGSFGRTTPHWYVATGFGKWGMTTSMVAAEILSDSILKKANEHSQVFSPQRVDLEGSVGAFVKQGVHAAKDLLRQVATFPREEAALILPGQGQIVEYQGEKTGVYKDEDGEIYAVSTRCPHMGCQLEWNPEERSWDCPCHGSRFDYKGRWLNGPAQTNISVGGKLH